jgi:YggT family protein
VKVRALWFIADTSARARRLPILPGLKTMVAVFQILYILLNVVWWIIVIQAIMSWLIAFNVINTYNDFVRSVWQALDKMTQPIYAPIRRIMPDFGALDLSPMVVLLILYILMHVVLPQLMATIVTI